MFITVPVGPSVSISMEGEGDDNNDDGEKRGLIILYSSLLSSCS